MSAAASAGPNAFSSAIGMVEGQLAMGLDMGIATAGLAGPIGGLKGLAEPLGAISQAATKTTSVLSSVANITQRIPQLNSFTQSVQSSEKLFSQGMFKQFNPEGIITTIGDVASIAKSVSQGNISDIVPELAEASNYATSAADLVELMNNGIVGFSPPGSKAQANSMGPSGLLKLSQKLRNAF